MELKRKVKIDINNPSIQRIDERCIDCGVCFNTCENIVGIDHTKEKDIALCINCGQCVLACPRAALVTKFNYKKVLNLIKDSDKIVTISIAPAVRTSLFEELSEIVGESIEGILPTILRKIGFDYVFDVTFGADVTVMEEASELLSRIKNKGVLPMFTSCCPSWVKYVEMFHPELIPHLSTTNSPIGIQSTLIKTYFKELNFIKEDIVSVVVAPCTAKKYEIQNSDTDIVITTRELGLMIKECQIDYKNLHKSVFDSLLSRGSKSGCMFGRSGGVMEATLNTASYLLTNTAPVLNRYHIEANEPITSVSYKLGDKIINTAVIYGMKNFEKLLPELKNYDFIEVMNCPKGCVGGGGQPLGPKQEEQSRYEARIKILNEQDNNILYSYQNEDVKEMYKYFLNYPLSIKAENLLHKKHQDLSYLVKHK